MQKPPLISFADDAEDVLLWRALGTIGDGTYVDGTAGSAAGASLTRIFSEAGWSGVLLASGRPIREDVLASRPRDIVSPLQEPFVSTGLPVHLAVLDPAQATADTLTWLRARPWVVVVRSDDEHADSTPRTDEGLLAHGYVRCLDHGRSRVLVASEHAEDLKEPLSTPPSSLDGYVRFAEHELRAELDEALVSLMRWRAAGIVRWAESLAVDAPGVTKASGDQLDAYARALEASIGELTAVRSTLSWRVTAPLRRVSGSRFVRALRRG